MIRHTKHDYVASSRDACTANRVNVEMKTEPKDTFVEVSNAYKSN
ncbi:unnamed protein product [Ectocarpus sp. 13 AM-2016]